MTKGSFYERLADHGHEVISDEDFAHLYAEGKGPPFGPAVGDGAGHAVRHP